MRSVTAWSAGAAGVLMGFSMFFRYSYGPWGVELSIWKLISHGWPDWKTLLVGVPIYFGLLEALFAASSLAEWRFHSSRLHARALIVFLVMTEIWQLAFIRMLVKQGSAGSRDLLNLAVTVLLAATTLYVILAVREADRKTEWLRLAFTLSLLPGLYPVSEWTPLRTVLWAYGMGYWMLLAGTLLMLLTSVRGA